MNPTEIHNLYIPVGWVITAISVLCGTIATLTTTFYLFLKSRLEAQDKILSQQDQLINANKAEIARLSRGCGIDNCHWKFR